MFTPAGVSDARNGFPVYLSLSAKPIRLLTLSSFSLYPHPGTRVQ